MESLLTGITQDATNPLQTEFDRPWLEQEAQHARAMEDWTRTSIDTIDTAVLDWDTVADKKSFNLDFAPDPVQARKTGIVSSYLTVLNKGQEIPGGPLGQQLYRDEIAQQRFNGRGVGDDDAFFSEITREATGRKTRKDLDKLLTDQSVAAAYVSTAAPDRAGEFSWEKFRETAKGHAGWKPGDDVALYERWTEVQDKTKESLAEFEEPLQKAFSGVEGGTGWAFESYEKMDGPTRKRFVDALAIASRQLAPDKQRGFWANLGASASRDTTSLTGKALTGMLFAEPNPYATPQEERDPAFGKLQRDLRDYRDDIARVQDSAYDPIKNLLGDGFLGAVEKGLYAAPGVAATSAISIVPVFGQAFTFQLLEESAYSDLRARFIENGMDYTAASEAAGDLSTTVGMLQYIPERIGLGLVTRKLPAVNQVLNAIGDRVSNRMLRGAALTGTITLGENVTEQIQNLTPTLVTALQTDLPDIDWNKEFDGFWSQNVTTMAAIFPLALFGAAGGLNADSRARAFAEASPTQLAAAGVSLDSIASLHAAKAQGPSSLNAAVDAAWQARDPNSDTAKEAVAQLSGQSAQLIAAAKAAESLGIAPRAVRDANGWTLYDSESGQEIGKATNADDAARLASAHANLTEEKDADRVAYLATMFQAAESTHTRDNDTRQTTTDLRPGERQTTDQASASSPQDAGRIAAQLEAREILDGGDGSIARLVLGQSSTDRTQLSQGIRRTVNRLQEGASVLTVFHEETHGYWREAQATGRLTSDDAVTFLRALDTVLATRKGREGQNLRLLPDGEVTATQIDEAISELMEAEVIRTRKGTGTRQLPAGIISRNLAALSRLAAGPTAKFRAFARALRAHFGLTLDRATTLQQGIKDGSIDAGEYDTFLTKLLGLDEQADHEQAARDAEAKLLDELLDGLIDPADMEAEADPFSLGPAALADAIRGDAFSRMKSPEKRIEAMSRIARTAEGLRLQAERLELLQGTKRLRRSLMKEAAMREAQRTEELENEAYARHYGILSNDDLTKIKSQPAHALLASPDSHLHGRLMSRSAAIAKHPDLFQLHRPGDFDGSDGISRSVFGGTLMPDQAAQELYDAGLIKSPTVDDLWDILRGEESMVDTFKEARKKATDDIRNARTQAKRETNEWLATQVETQEANFSPKQEILRTLALLDGILNVVPPEIRGKIGGYTQLARIASNELRLEFLKDRLAKVDVELEKWLKAQYGKEMEALLKRARPQKDEAGKRPRGTIGSDVHQLFRSIEDAMGMSLIAAEAEATYLETIASDEDITPEQQSHATLEANLIRLVADWHHASASRRESAVAEATRIFERGYQQHKAEVSARREQRGKQRTALKAATGKSGSRQERVTKARKDAKKIGRTLQGLLSLASFEQVTHHAFGENTPEANFLIDWERRASNAREDALQAKTEAFEQLFIDLAGSRFKGQQLQAKLQEDAGVTVTTSRGVQTMSQMEAIGASLMWRQEDGRRHMEGHIDNDGKATGEWHWTQMDMDSIEDQLSKEAKAVRLHLAEQYAAEWARLNPVFRQLYGVDLPRHKNYSPLTVKPSVSQAGQIADPVTGSAMSGVSLTPGSLRNRMQTGVAEPDFRDAGQTYLAHVRQMEHFMAYAPLATEAMALINTREVGNAVEAAGGKETLAVLRSWLDHFAQGGNRDASAHLGFNQSLSRKINRVAAAALVGRASVLVIQSLQLGAALGQMPTGAYLSRFAKLLSGQMNWWYGSKANLQSEFIQRRLKQMPPLVRQALDGLLASKPNRLKYWMARLGETISGADALFTAGTYSIIYDYQLKQAMADGLTGEEAEAVARNAAERSTERVAQPTRAGTRSLYEVTSTHPAAKILWAFASEPRQKLALTAYAFAKKPVGEKMRALAVTWLVGGVGASLIRAAMRDVRDDEDDELFDERNWDPKRLSLSSLAGPLQGIPILGDVLEGAIFKATGTYLPEGNLFSGVEGAIRGTSKVPDWFNGDREWEDIFADIEGILGGAAPFSDSAAAATSASHVVSDTMRILDNFLGD